MTRCGTPQPGGMFYCTRTPHHEGDHIATIGPYHEGEPIIAQWPRDAALVDRPGDLARHTDGTPASPRGRIRELAAKRLDEGDIIAVILRAPSGQLSLQAYEPPTRELLDRLMELAAGYRRVLQGH